MMRPFSGSYECGRRLAAAGIPLDYIESLPREGDAVRKYLLISPVGGAFKSRVVGFRGEGVRYFLAVRLSTCCSMGVVISDWSIATPWGHLINWDHDAADILPESDHPTYAKLFDSPLRAVLNERLHLERGRAVAGLLCGCATFESIPKSIRNGTTVPASLSLTDDTGQVFTQDIAMIVGRSATRPVAHTKREGRLFDKPDLLCKDTRDQGWTAGESEIGCR
jgi:hypothetical protein